MNSGQVLCDYPSAMPSMAAPPDEIHWYAIQTRARHEKTVAIQLQEKGVSVFLPLIAEVRRWSDRRKVVQLPLFPGYVFVRVALSTNTRLSVLRTAGVVGFVGISGAGFPIPDQQIEDIQTLLSGGAACQPYPFLKTGQRVRICGGCLDGIEGILVARNTDRSLVVSIEAVARSVAIRIEGFDIEPISQPLLGRPCRKVS